MAEIVKKRVDLLSFQKSLSKQFLAIVEEDDNKQQLIDDESVDSLGISLDLGNVQIFLPLENLKTIASENRFEKTLRTKSWLTGFNQERGDVYTIYDFEKSIKLLSTGLDDYEIVDTKNKQVVYLRDTTDEKQALYLYLDNSSLQYTAEYTKIFSYIKKENSYSWEQSEDIDFDSFIQKNNMSEFEWEIMLVLKRFVEKNEEFNDIEFIVGDNFKLFIQCIKDVYLDSMGVRPVFTLNTDNFTKYISTLSPF